MRKAAFEQVDLHGSASSRRSPRVGVQSPSAAPRAVADSHNLLENYLPDTAGQQKSEPPHGETGARVKTKGEGGREQRVAGATNRRACRACSEEGERAKVSKVG